MKKMILLAIMGMVLFGGSQKVLAASFSSTIDWNTSTDKNDGVTYLEIIDSYQYTFTLNSLNSSQYDLVYAQLELRHNGNSNTPGELWFSYGENGDTDILIGQLSGSNGSVWFIDTWTLTPGILSLIESKNPWSIMVNLVEIPSDSGADKLRIDYSTLSGNYNTINTNPPPMQPVPEPSTFLLLGAGLAGLAARRMMLKRRRE